MITTMDIAHFRAPYKDAMLNGFGTTLTNDIVDDDGLRRMSQMTAQDVVVGLWTAKIVKGDATGVMIQIGPASPIGVAVVPPYETDRFKSAGSWALLQQSAGKYVVISFDHSVLMALTRADALAYQKAAAEVADNWTVLLDPTHPMMFVQPDPSVPIPFLPGRLASLSSGMSTPVKVALGVGALAAVWMLFFRKKGYKANSNSKRRRRHPRMRHVDRAERIARTLRSGDYVTTWGETPMLPRQVVSEVNQIIADRGLWLEKDDRGIRVRTLAKAHA